MSDEFATYDDIMQDLANDRDDSYDPEFRDPDGYCPHGRYVGGSGIDLMCNDCEMGISLAERIEIDRQTRLRKIRNNAADAERILNNLLTLPDHCIGILAAHMAEISSNVNNPESRYGRTGWR
jgi:hypothetical protein